MNGLLLALMLAGGVTPPSAPCPPKVCLQDLDRFPSATLAEAYSHFAWEHMDWLRERKKFWLTAEERDYWRARFDDQHWRWDVWSDLRIAQEYAAQGYTVGALHKLQRIRHLIGDEAFYSGTMPPCCAIWHFQRWD